MVVVVVALSLAAMTLTGFAAGLGGVSAGGLGAGGAVVPACDSNGFTVGYTLAAGAVTAVTVSGIADPACSGGTSLGEQTATVPTGAGTSATVSFAAANVLAESVTGVHVVIAD